jgi:PLP dependent protein
MTAVDPAAVAVRLAELRARIGRAGGRDVRVVAVTKGFGPDAIDAASACGLTDVGENYAQELLAKLDELHQPRPRVHFIGRLQTNKVRHLAPVVDVWQTIDRTSAAAEVAKRAPGAAVLVQVNVSDEPQKGGCPPAEAPELVARCQGLGLRVLGLMTVGRTGSPDDARAGFALLSSLADRLGLPERSMGMTDDLEVAVQEGATMVRVGTALFGPRPRSAVGPAVPFTG